MREHVDATLRRTVKTLERLADEAGESLVEVARDVADALDGGGKVLVFGNGGSAADAQHIATELVVRFRADREREPLPAIAVTTNSSLLTAAANDLGYEHVFARQVRALGEEGDVAVGISTSGNSPNVLRGLEAAREQGLRTVLLSGSTGGAARALADRTILVPSDETARIQEGHLASIHVLCDLIERIRFPELCG